MSYLVLSRKYRPRSFDEVVGQAHITRTLKRAIESGRVAQAYLFAGTRGTGKTTMARILAKALNCVKGPTPAPCNSCDVCDSVDTGDDIDVIEIDGASHNSVEDVRELRSNAGYTPARARFKIYYIDEVHMLSAAAFNALLKVLEEPPAHVKFIFATTEPHKVPQTIQSRCQRFDFRNIPPEEVLARLEWMCGKEKIEAEDGALAVIARFAAGSMRDGESLLDQVFSFCGGHMKKTEVEEAIGVVPSEVMSALLAALVEGKAAPALEAVEKILGAGTAPRQSVSEFIDYIRDCLVIKTCGKDSRLVVRSSLERETIEHDASRWQEEGLIYAMQLLAETHARMGRSPQSRGLLDVSVLKLSRVQDFQALREFLGSLRGGEVSASGAAGGEPQVPFDVSRGERRPEQERGAQAKVPEGLPTAVWNAVVGAVSSMGTLVRKTIEQHATFVLSADRLKIGLPANFAPHKAALEKEDVLVAVEDAVSRALGRLVRVEVACNGAGNGRPVEKPTNTARKRALREQAELDPAVRKVLDTFDGSIVEVEE